MLGLSFIDFRNRIPWVMINGTGYYTKHEIQNTQNTPCNVIIQWRKHMVHTLGSLGARRKEPAV